MHHLEIEHNENMEKVRTRAEQIKARRAEAAMEALRKREPYIKAHRKIAEDAIKEADDFGRREPVFDDYNEPTHRKNRIVGDMESFNIDHTHGTANYYLQAAADEMADRAASRDASNGERSMARAVKAFNALYGLDLSETQGWQFMSILKKARSASGSYREDDHTDDVAYSALAAESAWKHNG